MLADWTVPNPVIDQALFEYKQGGIPFVLVIPPDGPAVQLPQIQTAGTVIKAFRQAGVLGSSSSSF
ncbi:MAG: hypothetical protein R3F11_25760 [Verrucomicrobiales bacterium]